MKITMLIENQKSLEFSKLKSEDGLSMLIEKSDKSILFDTGRSGAFIFNAEQLGINLKNIDAVVLSNAHRDHTGGLIKFLELNRKAKVYVKSEVSGEYGIQLGWFIVNCSINRKIFTKYIERIEFIENKREVLNELYLIPNIENTYPLATVSRNLIKKVHGDILLDDYRHELFLVAKEKENITILTGCSKNGVVSIIETAKKIFPKNKVQAVIGGMHLNGINKFNIYSESKEEVRRLAFCLKNYNIEKIYACHCTGINQYNILKEELGDKIKYFNTGESIEV